MAISTAFRSEVTPLLGRIWRPLVVAGAALVLALGGLALTRTGLFHVRSVDVGGNAHLSRAEVVRLAGVTTRSNAIWLDEDAARARLEQDPWVARAEVEVSLPWTVRVTILERTPVATMDRGAGPLLVAGDGTVLGAAVRTSGLPSIVTPPSWVAGVEQVDLQGAARALGSLEPAILERVHRVEVDPVQGLSLVLKDGVRVSFGSARLLDQKARALGDVLAWAEQMGERVRSIDVTAPTAPAVIAVS